MFIKSLEHYFRTNVEHVLLLPYEWGTCYIIAELNLILLVMYCLLYIYIKSFVRKMNPYLYMYIVIYTVCVLIRSMYRM